MSYRHAAQVIVPDDGTSPVGSDEWNAAHVGSVDVPVVVNEVGSSGLNTTNPSMAINAATSGNRLIVGVNLVGRGVSSITCTNVTFTQMFAATSGGSSHYEVWVGVVSGTSGTLLTVNTGSSNFSSLVCFEVTDALTPTAGTNLSAASKANTTGGYTGQLRGVTAGHFVVYLVGCDNTTTPIFLNPSFPAYAYCLVNSGTGVAMAVGYAPAGTMGGTFFGHSALACYTIIGEIT